MKLVYENKLKSGWCSECSGHFEAVIEVGEYDQYGSATAWLCRECLTKALALFDSGRQG